MSRIAFLAALPAVLLAGCASLDEWQAQRAAEDAFADEIAAVDRETWCGLYDPELDRQYLGPPNQSVAAPIYYAFEPMGLADFRALGYDALISKRYWRPEDSTIEVVQVVAAQSGGSELKILQNSPDRVPLPPLSASGAAFLDCLQGP